MTVHATDSMFERVSRADEHLADLRQRLETVRRHQADSITTHFDPNPPHKLLVGQFTKTFVGMSVGIRIGEICYNLRTALDYLIFELAKVDSKSVQLGTQFPVLDKKSDFDARKARWLKGLNASHVDAIERFQPFGGCNWTRALRDISNQDKHREFAEIGGDAEAWIYTRPSDANFDEIDAPLRRLPHPTMEFVDIKVYVSSIVKFSDGRPITQTLEEIRNEIAATLTFFKPNFDRANRQVDVPSVRAGERAAPTWSRSPSGAIILGGRGRTE